MALLPWLSRADLIKYIGPQEIPETFRVEKLSTTTSEVVEGWLTDLMGTGAVGAYRTLLTDESEAIRTLEPDAQVMSLPVLVSGFDPLPTVHPYRVSNLIIQFLAYAVWSVYVSKSNAINTDTGIVTKLNQDSERISDRQRSELSAYYRGLAERKATQLTACHRAGKSCQHRLTPAYGQPRVTASRPRNPSRLGN